jgi:hypothetical protein
MVLIVGFGLGYGVREWVSRRRRQAERGSGVPFGGNPPGRNLVVGRYCSGVSLMTPQVEWGTRVRGPGDQPPPGPGVTFVEIASKSPRGRTCSLHGGREFSHRHRSRGAYRRHMLRGLS